MRLFPILASAALSSACHAQNYTITELPLLAGMVNASANDLTDSGRVLVTYSDSAGGTRTFIWHNGVPTDLGVFQGLARTEGNEINENGVVAGSSWAATGFPAYAWRWENGVFTNLGSLGGYANGGGINAAGHVVGWAGTTTVALGGTTLAFFHDGISMKSLGQSASGVYADASSINALGQVVGSFGSQRRVSLEGAYLGDLAGGLHELPTLGGLDTNASRINDAGQVVGTSETGAVGPNNRYLLRAFVWSDGVMKDLGTFPGYTQSSAGGISNAGDIITGSAFSDTSTLAGRVALLWPQGGAPIDLSTRIPPGSGVELFGAGDINSSGQILAGGFATGLPERRAYLLTPVP